MNATQYVAALLTLSCELCGAADAVYLQEANGREWTSCVPCLPRVVEKIKALAEVDES